MKTIKLIYSIFLSGLLSFLSIFNIFYTNNKFSILLNLFTLLFLWLMSIFLILDELNNNRK